MAVKRSYFSYFFHSKGRHGIHSPFVFDFVDVCLTTKLGKNFKTSLKKQLEYLLSRKEKFKVIDLGAGSKKLSLDRSASELVKTSSAKGIYGNVLYRIASHYKPNISLELGTSIGLGSFILSKATPSKQIHTVEGCAETQRAAMLFFSHANCSNIVSFHAEFFEFLKIGSVFKYDLVYLDGNHSEEATLKYMNELEKITTENTLFILDDIRWSEGMWNAWLTLIGMDKYHLSIDLGRMGLIWKRPQQKKEHFVLRPAIFKGRYF